MSDESRHAVSELSRYLRSARDALLSGGAAPPFRDPAEARAWLADHRDRVLATLREADPEAAAGLLADAWTAVPPDARDAWCRPLHDAGVALAAALPGSLVLAAALRRGAQTLRAHGEHRLAVAQGIYELAIHRGRDDDPEATAANLADLAATYRAQGLLHEVADCLDEALETHLRHGNRPGVARTLADLGAVLLEAGRLDSAVDHLVRADRAFDEAPDPVRHARCLALLGRARARSGDQAAADRAFNRALGLLIGPADDEVRRVRDLVARLRSLPPDRPDEQEQAEQPQPEQDPRHER